MTFDQICDLPLWMRMVLAAVDGIFVYRPSELPVWIDYWHGRWK